MVATSCCRRLTAGLFPHTQAFWSHEAEAKITKTKSVLLSRSLNVKRSLVSRSLPSVQNWMSVQWNLTLLSDAHQRSGSAGKGVGGCE